MSGISLVRPNRRQPVRLRPVPIQGGFAIPVAAAAVHTALQNIKPITNGVKLAKSLGVDGRINAALEGNAVGRAAKSLGQWAQKTLGYGSKTMKTYRGGRRPGRPRKVGRPKTGAGKRKARK